MQKLLAVGLALVYWAGSTATADPINPVVAAAADAAPPVAAAHPVPGVALAAPAPAPADHSGGPPNSSPASISGLSAGISFKVDDQNLTSFMSVNEDNDPDDYAYLS